MTADPRPWLESVELHPDVLSQDFSEDIFALDLGALADYVMGKDLGVPAPELPRVPAVYRDADSFFGASYLTSGLRSLLGDVFGRLTGARGNRVLKLLTPFGGGKSHTLAALLHSARSRAALDPLPDAAGLPRPEGVRVAVVDGQFFDATSGKRYPKRTSSRRPSGAGSRGRSAAGTATRSSDSKTKRASPPAWTKSSSCSSAARGLNPARRIAGYLISAGGVRVEKTTLRDETLSFLKRLTVAVGNVDNAVLVYSLQSSKRSRSNTRACCRPWSTWLPARPAPGTGRREREF